MKRPTFTPPPAAALLREWFASMGITAKDFATSLELAPEYLSRIMAGRVRPSLVTRLAIEHVTRGRVPAASWGIK